MNWMVVATSVIAIFCVASCRPADWMHQSVAGTDVGLEIVSAVDSIVWAGQVTCYVQ